MGQFAGLQPGCADAPSCSPQGRKSLQKRPQDSQFPPSSLQACARGYHECRPGVARCISPPNPGLAPPLLLPPTPCQLKSRPSPGGPQVMLSVAQLGCVPALFSGFFFFFPSLLLMVSLLSHPPRLLRKELLGATIPCEAGCRRGPESSNRAVLGMMSLKTPQGCSAQPGGLSCRGVVERHPARSRRIAGAVP